jgi:hypothetical protein
MVRRRRRGDGRATPRTSSLAPSWNRGLRSRRSRRRRRHVRHSPHACRARRLRCRRGRGGGHHGTRSRSSRARATSRSLTLDWRCRGRHRLRRRRSYSRRRRRHDWGGGGLVPRRQECQRVDVSLRIVRTPNAEVHVGHVELRVSRRPDRPHRLAFCDSVARVDDERAEVEQRHREPVFGSDRDGSAVARQPAGEGDLPRRGSLHDGPRNAADVDPRMPPLVVLGAAEVERPQDGAVGGPGPGCSGRRPQETGGQQRKCRCLLRQHRGDRSKPVGCCQNRLQRLAVELVARDARQPCDDVGRGTS